MSGEPIRQAKDGSWSKRLRVRGKKVAFAMPQCTTEPHAKAREQLLIELYLKLENCKASDDDVVDFMRAVAADKPSLTLAGALREAEKALGISGTNLKGNAPTVAELADKWNSGVLRKQYGDTIRDRQWNSSVKATTRHFARYINPMLGDLPVDLVTLEDCDRLRASLPEALTADSRRQILTPLKTLLEYAVYPCKYLERSPIPHAWLPRNKGPRDLQWITPEEDRMLMACTEVPLWQRILFGFQTRNCLRKEETLSMKVSQFDLAAGSAKLLRSQQKQHKRVKERFWPLEPAHGCKEALSGWVRLRGAGPVDYMFVDDQGRWIDAKNAYDLPELLRKGLWAAGVRRPELFAANTKTTRRMCDHDLRASGITVAFMLGRPDKWITCRSGHSPQSSELGRYKRLAETLEHFDLGDWTPLNLAIPELRPASNSFGHSLANENQKTAKTARVAYSIVESEKTTQPLDILEKSTIPWGLSAASPGEPHFVGQQMATRIEALEAELRRLRSQSQEG